MNEENNIANDIDLDEAFESFEEEDRGPSLNDISIQRNNVNTSQVNTQMTESKLQQLQAQLEKVTSALESGKKTHYLETILSKYADIDPIFKQMLVDVTLASNEYSKENLKQVQQIFEGLEKEVNTIKIEQKNLSDYAASIHYDISTNRLVRKYLEKGFKKNTVKEQHVEKALDEHMKRLKKDEAYTLKFHSIWNTPGMSDTEKQRLTGQFISDNFRDVVSKTKSKKAAEELPSVKKSAEKDTQIEKDKKKLEKQQEENDMKADDPKLRASFHKFIEGI